MIAADQPQHPLAERWARYGTRTAGWGAVVLLALGAVSLYAGFVTWDFRAWLLFGLFTLGFWALSGIFLAALFYQQVDDDQVPNPRHQARLRHPAGKGLAYA